MSLIEKPGGIGNFSKALISFWFRVPEESIAAAGASFSGEDGKLLDGIIPLVVMGERGKETAPTSTTSSEAHSATISGPNFVDGGSNTIVSECGGSPCGGSAGSALATVIHTIVPPSVGSFSDEIMVGVTVTTPTGAAATPKDPTFIGIDCGGAAPVLRVNFESNVKPTVIGTHSESTFEPGGPSTPTGQAGLSYSGGSTTTSGCSPPFGLCVPFTSPDGTGDPKVEGAINSFNTDTGGGGQAAATPFSDTGTPKEIITDISDIMSNETGSIFSDQVSVEAEHWHHVLVSVNFPTIVTNGGGFASPGQIYVALDDVNYTGFGLSSDWTGDNSNDIVPDLAFDPIGTAGASYTLPSPKIPASGVSFGIPGTSSNRIFKVEMAEFQMWTGFSEDTASLTLRRLFIDEDGKPVNPTEAEASLGTPTVRLHGSGKWIAGKDTGSGTTFSVTPTVSRYKPDPSLNGPQSPGDK